MSMDADMPRILSALEHSGVHDARSGTKESVADSAVGVRVLCSL